MKETITAADCQSCGACCWSPADRGEWVDLEPGDVARLEMGGHKRFVRLHVLQPTAFRMLTGASPSIATTRRRTKAGPARGLKLCVCAALKGSPMQSVSCSVYDSRPKVCSSFKPGSNGCRELRDMLREQIARFA